MASRRIEPKPVEEAPDADQPAQQPLRPVAASDLAEADAVQQLRDTKVSGTEAPTARCEPQRTKRKTEDNCQTVQYALVTAPQDDTNESPESHAAGRSNQAAEQIVPVEAATELHQPATAASSSGSEFQNVESHTTSEPAAALPDVLVGDTMKDTVAGRHDEVIQSEAGPSVVAAGVFAVAFTKPLSRLTLPSSSPLGDPSRPATIPLFVPRRRKDSRKSKARTKDRPEDLEEPGGPQQEFLPWGMKFQSQVDIGIEARAAAASRYGPTDAAILALLDTRGNDPSEESMFGRSSLASMESFAAGALATAATFLALQGSRRPERRQPQLKPVIPSYVGPTVLAPN